MTHDEHVEKVRQEIMRLRELLDIMRSRLEAGERAYSTLFAPLSPEQTAGLREKEVQRVLAEHMLHDQTALSDAVLKLRFDSRDLERAFEELYNIIVTPPPEDD